MSIYSGGMLNLFNKTSNFIKTLKLICVISLLEPPNDFFSFLQITNVAC